MENENKKNLTRDLIKEFKDAQNLEKKVIESIAIFLNDSGLDIEDRKFLISPWCHTMTHSCISVINEGKICESQKWNPRYAPGETINFMELSKSDAFYQYLQNTLTLDSIKIKDTTNLIKLPFFLIGKILLFQTGLSKKNEKKLVFFNPFQFSRLPNRTKIIKYAVDIDSRIKLKDYLKKQLYGIKEGEWIANRLSEMFPRSLLEGIQHQKLIYSKKYRFSVIFSSDSWSSLDSLKMFSIFQRKLRDITFIGTPHSLNYSTLEYFWLRDYELSFLNKYLIWGNFNINYDKKNIPFSSPKLTSLSINKIKYKSKNNNNVIYTGAARPSHTTEYPYLSSIFEKYLINQINLAKSINMTLNKKVILRTRSLDRGNHLIRIKSELNPINVEIDHQTGNFLECLENSSIHITDNTSTTILESLSVNFPTVILIDDLYFKMSKSARESFEELEKAGVFYTNNQSLLNHLKNIDNDILDWWNSINTQLGVKNFLELHGKRAENINTWKKQFLKIL